MMAEHQTVSTSRRNFLKSICAAVALSPLLCRLSDAVETVQEPTKKVCINPAWESAPYEVAYCYHPDVFKMIADEPNIHAIERKGALVVKDIERFNFVNGEFVKVEKHI